MSRFIQQHNVITEARYDLSVLEKNIVYLLMATLSENDPPEKENIVLIEALSKSIGREVGRGELERAIENLIRRPYEIVKENGNLLVVSLMTVVKHDAEANLLKIKISRKVLPYFLALKENYTVFQLDMALILKNKYAKRIYEMLSQHKQEGVLAIAVQDLKYRLSLIDKEKKKEMYAEWPAFLTHVIEVAKNELAEKTDIRFTYEAIKTGRKHTHLRFVITPQKVNES